MTVINPGGGGGTATPAFAFGTAAARPAAGAGNAKTGYYATDTGEVTFSDGAAWNTIQGTSAAAFSVMSVHGALQAAGNVVGGNYAVFNSNGGNAVAMASAGGLTFGQSGSGFLSSNGDIDVGTTGKGLRVAEGANGKQGTTGAMTAGAVTVANTSITANSRILVCRSAGGTNPGAWYVSAQTAGTSFVVTSTNAADTGNGVFQIFEPG
jgi:hypothetical protein